MARTKRTVARKARRKKVLQETKGYFGRRKNLWTIAKEAREKALCYAYQGRKQRKREFRKLWIQRINAAARQHGISYGVFVHGLTQANINLDRKSLSFLAAKDPDGFAGIVHEVKGFVEKG
ncbi:MAG: 50S ribosomal protein L20 [Cytophagales bacterium]|nr:50S ribosomal protein L20 [Cytophagales bacterium]